MSILDVAHLSHSYGGREIFEDVSFRLEKGEHVALVGANGEGKSTFMSIITGKLSPDDGKITWARRTKVGYMDQHAALEAGKTIRETLRTAFQDLVDEEKEMLAAYDKMASASPDELERLMADTAEIQERLEAADYYNLDTKIEEVAAGLGLRDIGLDHKVDELSGGQRTKVLLTKLLLQHPDILLLDEPTNYLDAEHIEWLTRYLQNYENAFIVISHDAPFLNAVTNVMSITWVSHVIRQTMKNLRKWWPSNGASWMPLMNGSRQKSKKNRTSLLVIRPVSRRGGWPIAE